LTRNASLIGLTLLLAVSLGWGVSWPIFKFALTEIPPWTFRALCVGVGGFLLLIIALISDSKIPISRSQFVPLVILSIFNVTIWNMLSVYGVSLLSSGRAAIVGFTMPLWAVLFGAIMLNENITHYKVIGLILGLSGLICLLGTDLHSLQYSPIGTLLMLVAATSWGLGTVLVKYFRFTQSALVLAGWQLVIGGIPIYIGAITFEAQDLNMPNLWSSLAMLYMIVISFVLCYWGWFKVLEYLPAGVAANCLLLVPMIGVASGAIILGESIGWTELCALALIVTGIASIVLPSAHNAQTAR